MRSHETDVDIDWKSLHHTLGFKPGQAASGTELRKLLDRVAELEARVEALEE